MSTSRSMDLPANKTEVVSTSPALTVSKSGTKFSLGIDPQLLVATKAASVVNEFTAGEPISALKAVYEQGGLIYLADHSSLLQANCVGIAISSGLAGASIQVLQYGVITDPSFNFNPADLLFLTTGGTVSTVAPDSGYLVRLGRAINTSAALIIVDSPKAL